MNPTPIHVNMLVIPPLVTSIWSLVQERVQRHRLLRMTLREDFTTTGQTYHDVWFSRGNITLSGIDFLVPDAHQFLR